MPRRKPALIITQKRSIFWADAVLHLFIYPLNVSRDRLGVTNPVPEPNVLLPFIDLTVFSGQAFFLWSPAPENSKNVSAATLAHPCSSIVLAYGAEIGAFLAMEGDSFNVHKKKTAQKNGWKDFPDFPCRETHITPQKVFHGFHPFLCAAKETVFIVFYAPGTARLPKAA